MLAELGQEPSVPIKDLDPVVQRIDDVQHASPVQPQPSRVVELPVCSPPFPQGSDDLSLLGVGQDAMPKGIRDIEKAGLLIEGYAHRALQLFSPEGLQKPPRRIEQDDLAQIRIRNEDRTLPAQGDPHWGNELLRAGLGHLSIQALLQIVHVESLASRIRHIQLPSIRRHPHRPTHSSPLLRSPEDGLP